MYDSRIARDLADDYRSHTTDDDAEVLESEVIEDAREAVVETHLIEMNPHGYVARVQAQAKQIARAEPSEDTDELTRYLNEVVRNRAPMDMTQAMDAARRGDLLALIEGNLLLVVSVALKWRGFNRSIMDLIGEGNVELTRVATRYDVSRNFAFSTYGIFYIKNGVRAEALRQDTQFASIPPASRRQLGALYVARSRFERAEGRALTLRETAERLRKEDAERDEDKRTRRRAWPDDEEILAVMAAMDTRYLSQLMSAHAHDSRPSHQVTVADTLMIDPTYDPIAEVEAKWMLEDSAAAWIRDLRATRKQDLLDDAELHLLCLRFGLPHPATTWEPPTGWEVGHVHSLRWVAARTDKKYEWTRKRLIALIARLASSDAPIAQRIARLVRTPRPLIRYHADS
jgi:DNA-directed RNA polymerase sigma subunit (sigma70/sigma32)